MITQEALVRRQQDFHKQLELFSAKKRRIKIAIGAAAVTTAGFLTARFTEIARTHVWHDIVNGGSIVSPIALLGITAAYIIKGERLKDTVETTDINVKLRSILPDINPPISLAHSMKRLSDDQKDWVWGKSNISQDPTPPETLILRSGIAHWMQTAYKTGLDIGSNEVCGVAHMLHGLYDRYKRLKLDSNPDAVNRMEMHAALFDQYLPIKQDKDVPESVRWLDFVKTLAENDDAAEILTTYTDTATHDMPELEKAL